MITHPIPTPAEVTDVANAIHEEVDAVMLSGETSVGKYPLRCVEQLVHIAREEERDCGGLYINFLELEDPPLFKTSGESLDLTSLKFSVCCEQI